MGAGRTSPGEAASSDRPRQVGTREVFNALRYIARSGCTWRALPHDFPPWNTVAKTYYRWLEDQTWDRVNQVLRESVLVQAGKKVKGRKRHLLVDTLGLILAVIVHTAGLIDEKGAEHLFSPELSEQYPEMEITFADRNRAFMSCPSAG